MAKGKQKVENAKVDELGVNREEATDEYLTTNQGLRINDDQNSLKAGERGPTLLEDFHLREGITHFDHERIPERVVHSRSAAAHGVFESTEVVGNFCLGGNTIPVYFIQDGLKFPDLIHAVKPEPDREIPQAQSAHDTFWDFASLQPETTHMLMWVMSDRAIPRSYRTMEGFGVHTFRLVNDAGETTLAKFHWKPAAGIHGLAWDEAQKIVGADPDFHRRDLWNSI